MTFRAAWARWLVAAVVLGATITPFATPPAPARALASLPTGFADSEYATGFAGRLTTMTWGPGDRLFVSEKQGSVRIVRNGVLAAQPFLSVSTATDSEKGLKGIAFDPAYASNGRVYVYYTHPATLKNRVSRFTVSATDPDAVDPATELVLVDGIDSGIYHSGGALHFGSDGKLYISTGDASYAPNAQNLGNLSGKILRLNTDGSAPASNPFVGQAGRRAEIWAYGLRNPYTFAFDPGSSRLYINDVGNSAWEEINIGAAGANYGWPGCEGACSTPGMVNPLYAYHHDAGPGKSITGAVFYRGGQFPAEYAGDYFFGDYVGNYIKRYDVASGQVVDFATNALYPVDLDIGPDGALYYLSVETRKVHRIAYGASPPPPPPDVPGNLFANGGFESTSGWPSPWRFNVRSPAQGSLARDSSVVSGGTAAARTTVTTAGRDWHAQLLQPNIALTAGDLHRLRFMARAATNRTVRVALQRNSAPYDVYFQHNVAITTGWREHVIEFTPTVTDPRALFNFNVGASSGEIWLDDVALTVSRSVGAPPVAQITAPSEPARYRATDRISFAGAASDPEDGTLAAAALTWEVAFHHDQHTHPYVEPFSGSARGSFVASDTGETSANVWYRIHLTATDSDGNTHTDTLDVHPHTSRVTLATQPAGLSLSLDGSPIVAPHEFTGVVGFQREVSAPASQTMGGTTYNFVSWSDGGAATHSIVTPGADTTLTAVYRAQGEPANAFQNAGFDNPNPGWLAPWRMKLRSPAAATISRVSANTQSGAAAQVEVSTAASLDWYAQLAQPNVPLSAGTTYTISFWARATAARPMRFAFQKASAPYGTYVERTITVGTAWQRHSFDFVAPSTDASSLFNLNFGTHAGTIWFDSFSLAAR